jgi:hypothetical protein
MGRPVAPDWPAMMRRPFAAAFCGVTVAEFEREVAAGRLPAPVDFAGGESWSRVQLAEALGSILGEREADWRAQQPLWQQHG